MKIMVCYDGSDNAKKGLRRAVDYFRADNPEFVLVTVAKEALDVSSESQAMGQELQSEHHTLLEDAAKWVSDQGCRVEALLAVGNPQQMILEAAEKMSPDIAVVARHEKHGLNLHFLESISSYMLKHAKCDLMVMSPSV